MTRYATIIPPVKRIEVELVHLLKEFKLSWLNIESRMLGGYVSRMEAAFKSR
jgi:hypothetical protein